MKLDIKLINKYISEGKLIANKHPSFPLLILNYTRTTQYNKYWDSITLRCRGLVIDEKGNIISRPLRKFFNYEEQEGKYAINFRDQERYPIRSYIKYDGCLITIFWYKEENQWIVTSRGSFDSEYSNRALECIDSKSYVLENLHKDYTYCFELTSPDNKIVVDYQETDLVLLAAINTRDKVDENISTFEYVSNFKVAEEVNLDIAKYKSLHNIKALDYPNQEGFVLKQGNNRCKIKFENYVKLHSFKQSITDKNILEYLTDKNKDIQDLINIAPDEMDASIKEKITKFTQEFNTLKQYYIEEYNKVKDIPSDKYFARDIKHINNNGVLFNMRKEREYDSLIWNIILKNLNKTKR